MKVEDAKLKAVGPRKNRREEDNWKKLEKELQTLINEKLLLRKNV